MEVNKKEYGKYVKSMTPAHNTPKNVMTAFITGGIICTFGQFLLNFFGTQMGMEKDAAGSWTMLVLIFSGVLLTGLNIYHKIVKFGGAGALVPITGFANSVAAPAIEYQTEGQVFGVGCKIFTIAGPVILFGVLTSFLLGIVSMVTGFGL